MIRKIFLLITLFMIAVVPLAAQDDTAAEANPLLRLLALVPDTPETRMMLISYADYRAMETIRGIETPSVQDFTDRTDLGGQWIAATTGLTGGLPLQNFFTFLEEMPDTVGFDFFAMDRSLVFGQPPSVGNIIEGNFDPDQIAAAFSARDFTENDFNGVPVWCGVNGCENGMETDLANRNSGNPFGGDLGRSEPVGVVLDSLVVNSASDGVVQTMIDTYQGGYRSLAEADDYRAIAEALADQGIIAQVQFLNPLEMIAFDPAVILGPGTTAESMEQLREAVEDELNNLPPYSAVALADVGTEDEQLAVIALAYADVATAEAAGEELVTRLENFTSIRTRQPFMDVLEASEATINAPTVYENAETGMAVTVVSIAYPLPDNERQEDIPAFQSSSLLYRFLMGEVFARGLYILAADFGS